MRYICEICGYETDDGEWGDSLPEEEDGGETCPVCGVEREYFYPAIFD